MRILALGIMSLFLASVGIGFYIAMKRWKPAEADPEHAQRHTA